jgi:hypothetical protein
MGEQPPTGPPAPDHGPSGVPPQPPSRHKPPFEWKKFFLGVAILPALTILWGLAGAAMGALHDATNGAVPSGFPAGPGLALVGAAIVGGIVMLTQPTWRPVGAGLLAFAAVSAILLGAACIALIAMLSQAH